jgi:hypothetical protein
MIAPSIVPSGLYRARRPTDAELKPKISNLPDG